MKASSAVLSCLVGWVAFTAAALAQPATPDSRIEQVIVTAPKLHSGVTPNAVAHDFVGSFALPSVLSEQISRWETPICPGFYGLAPQYAAVMESRFRTIAGAAGAPLKDKGCKPNMIVAVTPQPQTYLDTLHARNVDALGYHGAVTITHPVQAWYVTGLRDIRGTVFEDRDAFFQLNIFGDNPTTIDPMSTAPVPNVGGWRFRPDASSEVMYVTIIVDSAKAAHHSVGAVADYVAMLALSRSEDYGDCQLMPSITNLLSSCDDKLKPDQITPTDIAYLRGVYKMDAGAKLIIQQDEIAAEMAKTLSVRSGP